MDESVMNEYREVVLKSEFETIKNENARIKKEIPLIKDQIESVKIQTKNINYELNFMMVNVENIDDVKKGYDKQVQSLAKDIELLKSQIHQGVNKYSSEKIQLSNMDITFKRILNVLIQKKKNSEVLDDHLKEFL